MKKNLIFAFAAFCSLSVLLTGCNSQQAKITITEDDAEYLADVYGGDDFFELVPGSYNVKAKKGKLFVTVPLKIVKGKRHPNYIVEELILSPTNAEDNYVKTGDKNVEFYACDKEAAYKNLCAASIGDVVNVDFQYTPADKKAMNEILTAIASCEVDLFIEEPDEEEISVRKNSTDWNKVLNSYESYVNQYIAVLKKVNAGDMSAYSDMTSLMEKYEELASQLENAEDDLTPAQAARFNKITSKLATAAL